MYKILNLIKDVIKKYKKLFLMLILIIFIIILNFTFPGIFISYIRIWVVISIGIIFLTLIYLFNLTTLNFDQVLTIGVISLTALFFLLQDIQNTKNSIDEVIIANQYNCLTAESIVEQTAVEQAALTSNPNPIFNMNSFVISVYENNLGTIRQKMKSTTTLPLLLSTMISANAEISINESILSQGIFSSKLAIHLSKSISESSRRIVRLTTNLNDELGGQINFCDLKLFGTAYELSSK